MTERVQPDLVILLRRHHAAGKGVSYLARRFGLSRQTVSNIIRFKTHAKVVDIGEPLEVFEPVSTKPRVKRPGPASADSFSGRLIKDPPAPAATPSHHPQPPRGRGWESPQELYDAARARERKSQEMAVTADPEPDPETETAPVDVQQEPTSAPTPSPAPTEALDVQPDPVDVDVQPEPEPEPPVGPRPGDVQPSPTPPDTRREPEPDVQPDPEPSPSPVDVQEPVTEEPVETFSQFYKRLNAEPAAQPEPKPEAPDPSTWGAKPFVPKKRR